MEAVTGEMAALCREFVSIAGDPVEEALGVPVEITNANFWPCNFNGLLPSL